MPKAVPGHLEAGQVTVITGLMTMSGQIEIIKISDNDDLIWVRFDGVDPEPWAEDNFVVIDTHSFNTNRRTVNIKLFCLSDCDFTVEGSIYGA